MVSDTTRRIDRRRRAISTLFCCFVVLVLGIVPLLADDRRIQDDNDTTGPLDIAWVKHGHRTNAKEQRQLVHTIRLFERWPVQRLKHRGFINLFFDLKGDPDWREERAIYITYHDGHLRAELVDFAADPPQFMRLVPMWRPDGRTVKVAFRRSALRNRSYAYYEWHALSFIEERHPLCDRPGGCSDGVRSIRHSM